MEVSFAKQNAVADEQDGSNRTTSHHATTDSDNMGLTKKRITVKVIKTSNPILLVMDSKRYDSLLSRAEMNVSRFSDRLLCLSLAVAERLLPKDSMQSLANPAITLEIMAMKNAVNHQEGSLIDSRICFMAYFDQIIGDNPNAAPEWQARSLGWRSRELEVACPLEGLVRGFSKSLPKKLKAMN